MFLLVCDLYSFKVKWSMLTVDHHLEDLITPLADLYIYMHIGSKINSIVQKIIQEIHMIFNKADNVSVDHVK